MASRITEWAPPYPQPPAGLLGPFSAQQWHAWLQLPAGKVSCYCPATMRTIEPIPAKTLGTLTAHGAGWINSRAGHYRLMGWGTLEPWEEQAACHDTPIELWFGQELPFGKRGAGRTRSQTLQAKAICAACPVLEDCRQWALEFRMPFGVLGGLTERERLEIIEGKPLGRGTKLIKPSR